MVYILPILLFHPLPVGAQECPPGSIEIGRRIEGNKLLLDCKCDRSAGYTTIAGKCRRPVIGAVGGVDGEVLVRQPDGTWKQAASGIAIRYFDHLKTGPKGRVQFLLADQTTLTVGPDTEIVLDDFFFDPDARPTARLLKGVFKFTSNRISRIESSENFRITTPIMAVGIRGTDLVITHDPNFNESRMLLREGEVQITNETNGEARFFSSGVELTLNETGIIEVLPLTEQSWTQAVQTLDL